MKKHSAERVHQNGFWPDLLLSMAGDVCKKSETAADDGAFYRSQHLAMLANMARAIRRVVVYLRGNPIDLYTVVACFIGKLIGIFGQLGINIICDNNQCFRI